MSPIATQGLIFVRAAGGQRADAQDATSPRVPRLGVAALCTHTITDFDTCPATMEISNLCAAGRTARRVEMREWIGPETPASQNTMHSSMHFQCFEFPLAALWSPRVRLLQRTQKL